jgi:hypothetical protein
LAPISKTLWPGIEDALAGAYELAKYRDLFFAELAVVVEGTADIGIVRAEKHQPVAAALDAQMSVPTAAGQP